MTQVQRENETLKTENFLLKQEVAQLKKLLFSSKRERFVSTDNPQQARLFDDRAIDSQEQEEPTQQVVKKQSKPKSRQGIKRNVFPAHLRREETIINPEGNTAHLTKIGEDITELLAYSPASVHVKKIIRPRLVDKNNQDKGVLQAPIPARIVPKGMVDESLIAGIIVEKIQFHTPVYRFAKKLKQAGIGFVRQNNLHNWLHTAAHSLLPLYHLLIDDILNSGYVQGDETRIPVLAKNKPGAAHRGQMWAFHAPTIRAVGFNYEPTRSTESANVILDRFSGTLQTDGYSVYQSIGKRKDIDLVFCMAHSRRKFYDARDSAPTLANCFLEKVQSLYEIERQARDKNLTNEQRLELRQEKAVPILKQLRDWLTLQHADRRLLPKSLIRKAIDYSLPRWTGLSVYAHDGKLEIDNNLVENTIRPIALGRKNYMFAGSHEAAQNLAVLYSIIGTCEKHNINAYKYLHWVLKKIALNKVTPQAIKWLPHRIDPIILENFTG